MDEQDLADMFTIPGTKIMVAYNKNLKCTLLEIEDDEDEIPQHVEDVTNKDIVEGNNEIEATKSKTRESLEVTESEITEGQKEMLLQKTLVITNEPRLQKERE